MEARAPSTDPPSAEAFQRLIGAGSPDLHTVTDLDGVYRFVSPPGLEPFGWDAEDVVGYHQDDFIHPDDVALVVEARQTVGVVPTLSVMTICRFRTGSGAYRWTEARCRRVDAGPGPSREPLLVWSIRDIGERKQAELDLQRQASTDPLTGVANRTVFVDRLQQALRRLDRQDGLVAVLFLDLDRFKLINDTLGHLTGDDVLLQMAERLTNFLRPQDTLARLGGDEFAVVIEGLSHAEEAIALSGRVIEAGRSPFTVRGETFTCTTSVGIAVTSDANRSAESLLQEADLALYRAKDRGRDRAEVFDEDLRTRAVGRLGVERMLRRAIGEERLRVEFQPIIDLTSGKTVAAETLVRVWDDEEHRLVGAADFIDVAEETGLLAGIDDWVLGQAIVQAAAWSCLYSTAGFADVAVNVTARHLADPGFAKTVVDELAAYDLPAGALQVEVTERVLMEASNSAMTGLKLLRDAGVKVGLDDFGTGYSSLSYLRLFPLDFVKIDKSFIRELASGPVERAIVGSIIEMSHALGMAVVAEGVETDAQLEQLRGLGCDRAQGYLFAPSGPATAIEERVLRVDADERVG